MIIDDSRWRCTKMNPGDPNLHATIKLHKQDMQIRTNATGYELAKHLPQSLGNYFCRKSATLVPASI